MIKRNGLSVYIKLFNKGKWIYSRTSDKWRVLYDRLRTHEFSKGYIKVSYGNEHFNDATFDNLIDAKWYLKTFTEGKLVKYLQS